MKSDRLFCSVCDRPVQVLITEAPLYDGHAPIHSEELVCLEIGDQCTGSRCPLGAADPNDMVRRVVRNGVPLDSLHTVVARCPGCAEEAEIVLYGAGRASCSVCGTVARWVVDHVEPAT